MAQEIERKFLVKSKDFRSQATEQIRIIQGYISRVPERTVRLRIKGDMAYITIKGLANASGVSRFEWENEISVKDAVDLLKICEPGVIEKIRYEVVVGKHTFEVDEFFAENAGLVVAEIELTNEDEKFEKPDWLGEEVTGITKYYNSELINNPFTKW